jgi:hypothetical protein
VAQKLSFELSCGGVAVTADAHPNKMKFSGVLVRLDEASDRPPNGSEGHRILVPKSVAEDRLKTLLGMGLNYKRTLDGHAQQHKVGVITKAWINGRDLHVEGHLWKHDFPEAQQDLKKEGLGMSMEIGEVHVENPDAKIWTLSDFQFLGATILSRNAAAYSRTLAIAASRQQKENSVMMKTGKKKVAVAATQDTTQPQPLNAAKVARIAAKAAAEAVGATLSGVINRQTSILAGLATKLDALDIASARREDEEEDEEEATADMAVPTPMTTKKEDEEDDEEASAIAAKKKEPVEDDDDEDGDEDQDEDDDMESAVDTDIDRGNLEDMGPSDEDDADLDDEPGQLSKGATNKGDKTTVEDKVGKDINKAITGSRFKALMKQTKALAAQVQTLTQRLNASAQENKKLQKQFTRVNDQVVRASSEVTRRSVPAELQGLLQKGGLDPIEMTASGAKITASEFDAILANAGVQLDNLTRIRLKGEAVRSGFMEEGAVDRGYRR